MSGSRQMAQASSATSTGASRACRTTEAFAYSASFPGSCASSGRTIATRGMVMGGDGVSMPSLPESWLLRQIVRWWTRRRSRSVLRRRIMHHLKMTTEPTSVMSTPTTNDRLGRLAWLDWTPSAPWRSDEKSMVEEAAELLMGCFVFFVGAAFKRCEEDSE